MLITTLAAALLVGQASVIDGGTIEIHDQRVRLYGIDAMESRQLCWNGKRRRYACGREAALALDDFIGDSVVSCESRGHDRYRRILARCSVRGEDLGAWLVESGHALAYRQYSRDYVKQERGARKIKGGVWKGKFVKPWEWR
jgi:endonuclease YncB( thermonuclease family)